MPMGEMMDAARIALALVTAARGGSSSDEMDLLLQGIDPFDVLAATVGMVVSLLDGIDSKSSGFSQRWMSNTGLAIEMASS